MASKLTKQELKNIIKGKTSLDDKRKAVLDAKSVKVGVFRVINRRIQKKAWNLGWLEHSNTLVGNKIIAKANLESEGLLKERMLAMGKYIAESDGLCWDDLIDFFNYEIPNLDGTFGWYPWKEGMEWLLTTFAPFDFMKRLMSKKLKVYYPNIKDGWHDN